MPWSNQGGGPWGSGGRQGALGLGASSRPVRRRPISRSCCAAARTGCARCCRAASRRQGARPDRARRDRDLGLFRLLPCRSRRARRGAALRQICARGAARPELSPAVSDRDRADAEGAARQQDRHRHARGRGSAPRHHDTRRAGREPDAHRRREHRRRRFLRALEDQAERRGRLSVQHPAAGRHGEGGRRERHARGGRPLQHPADPDRRAAEHRDRRAGSDAEGARQIRRRHPDHAGAAAEGRSALAGDRCLPRRAGRPRRPRARAERGADLRQPGGAGSARPRRPDHPERRSLSRADGGRGQGPDVALPPGLRRIQEGAGRHPPAHVSRDHGAAVRGHRQDHHGFRSRAESFPICRSTSSRGARSRRRHRSTGGAR